MENYQRVHQRGISSLAWAKQMDAHFGAENVDHFITHFGFGEQPLTWNSEVYFGGRFSLSMQVPVNVNYSTGEVSAVDDPAFYLFAVSSIDRQAHTAQYDGKLQRRFGEEEWRKLTESGFDLSVLNIPKDAEVDIPQFDRLVAGFRQPRVKIDR